MRFVLLDRITALDPPRSARGVKCVSLSDDVFEHHFPGHPIFPGVLLVEAMAQVAGVLLEMAMRERGQLNYHALLVRVVQARFRHMVRPGDRIEMEVTADRISEDGAQVRGVARVQERVVGETELWFAFARVTSPSLIARREELLQVWLHGSVEPLQQGKRDEAAGR
jgi:3-hydroxymyristoyl/3-hydroxydecanoyl-(acyl carrier protein) dehydratase